VLLSAQEGSNAKRISNVFNNSYTVLLSGATLAPGVNIKANNALAIAANYRF
jgi:hypothetical protein